MMDEKLRLLLEKYLTDSLDRAELAQFHLLINQRENQETLNLYIDEFLTDIPEAMLTYGADKERSAVQLLARIKADNQNNDHTSITGLKAATPDHESPSPLRSVQHLRTLRSAWFRYAAILLLAFGTGAYFFYNYPVKQSTPSVTSQSEDIPPGTQGAILTLADGTRLVLDSMGPGVVAEQYGSRAVLKNGRLAYDPVTGQDPEQMSYNTLATPRGRQFQLVLADGSKVWLNTASSLRYPMSFNGKERRVEVKGEAYFEIKANSNQPFYVTVNGTDVQVLGTSFNINSYSDEPTTRITLLEGAVRVGKNILKPGQQSQVHPDGSTQLTEPGNTERVVAWKNKTFDVTDKTLQELMREIARWYDVEIVYEGIPRKRVFYGEIEMNLTLTECLRGLEKMQVHCKLADGRRLVVYP